MSERFPIAFGRYQLLERLAIGGMAELFLAQTAGASEDDEKVVIKRLLPHMASQPQFNEMFLDEAKLTARLTHPKIAQTYEFSHHGEQLYIAMEFVDGIDTLALLRECAHRRVRLPTEIAVFIAHEILDALDFAHNEVDEEGKPLGVVHRDISPSNVLLALRGDIKLVDFGIARASQRSHHTKDGTLKGKYGYMSPEQVLDDHVDARSDLFSVGIVLAELLTGRRLFAAPNELDVLLMVRDAKLDRLDRFGSHIGLDLDRVVRKSLRKRPDDRFDTAAAFRDALAEWMFMHDFKVEPFMISEVVDEFYEDAWKRKRGAAPGAQWKALQALGTPPGPADSPDLHEVEQIDGIPVGQGMSDTDSLPVVSIEDLESAPNRTREISGSIDVPALGDGIVKADVEWDETNRLLGHKDPVSSSVTVEYPDVDEIVSGALGDGGDVASIPMQGEISIGLSQVDDNPEAAEQIGETNPTDAPDTASAPIVLADAVSADAASADATDGAVIEAVEDLKTPAPYNPKTEINAHPDDAGEFSQSPPIGVLFRLAVSRATGLLVVSVGGIYKEIYFRDGIPEYVSSNVANELFGEYLMQKGVISSGELSTALAVMSRYRNRLGDTMVGLGLLTPLEVLRELTQQVRKKLIDVCTWSKGEFCWFAGRENLREAFPLDLNAFEVIGAGALALPEDTVSEWLSEIGDIQPQLVRNGRISPEVFQLGSLMRQVCGALDGVCSLAELRVQFAQKKAHSEFVRVLYLLMQTGLVVASV